MAKKIYDIKPPRTAQKAEDGIKEFLAGDKSKKKTSKKKREKHFPLKPVLILAGALLLIVAVYLFFALPKADIEIWPKTNVLGAKQTIAIDKTADTVDLAGAIIPAQYMEEEKSGTQEFSSTGNGSNEGKAQGTITIYNKFDPPSPITLKAGTHFLSDSGKYFVTLAKVVVPAAKKSGSKITPGSIDVKVEAAEGGDGYNIGAAKFSVPKLAGTAYYYSVYAESTKAMSGGFASNIKKVTADDIQSAKDNLTQKLLTDAENSLKGKISSDMVLLPEALSSEIESSQSQAKAGTIADTFNYQAKVKAMALVVKKADLEKFARDYIVSKMQESETILDKSFNVAYTANGIDVQKGTGKIDLDFSSKVYQDVDKNSLSLLLRGKNPAQINQIITEKLGEQISKIKVNLWPFWVVAVPQSQKAIKIDLMFE